MVMLLCSHLSSFLPDGYSAGVSKQPDPLAFSGGCQMMTAKFICLLQKSHQRSIPPLSFPDLKQCFPWYSSSIEGRPIHYSACEDSAKGGAVVCLSLLCSLVSRGSSLNLQLEGGAVDMQRPCSDSHLSSNVQLFSERHPLSVVFLYSDPEKSWKAAVLGLHTVRTLCSHIWSFTPKTSSTRKRHYSCSILLTSCQVVSWDLHFRVDIGWQWQEHIRMPVGSEVCSSSGATRVAWDYGPEC